MRKLSPRSIVNFLRDLIVRAASLSRTLHATEGSRILAVLLQRPFVSGTFLRTLCSSGGLTRRIIDLVWGKGLVVFGSGATNEERAVVTDSRS